jgi:hypothetical protein
VRSASHMPRGLRLTGTHMVDVPSTMLGGPSCKMRHGCTEFVCPHTPCVLHQAAWSSRLQWFPTHAPQPSWLWPNPAKAGCYCTANMCLLLSGVASEDRQTHSKALTCVTEHGQHKAGTQTYWEILATTPVGTPNTVASLWNNSHQPNGVCMAGCQPLYSRSLSYLSWAPSGLKNSSL